MATQEPDWSTDVSSGPVQIRFVGRGTPRDPARLGASLDGLPPSVSWLEQIHSGEVVEACGGDSGRADGLTTERAGVALAIATADCVPVLFTDNVRIAAAHAGWRGLVAGVLGSTLDSFPDPAAVSAWIGPAIGPCCYEVGDEVAERLVTVSSSAVVSTPPGGKAHVDLRRVAIEQLRSNGLASVQTVELCTRCHPELLWSYRRTGEAAGRNWSLIWKR